MKRLVTELATASKAPHWDHNPSPRIWDRENVQKQLQDALEFNSANLAKADKQSHKICTALGFVGIGKTTVGRHLASTLKLNNKPVKYVFVDFSNGDRVDEAQQTNLQSFSMQVSLAVIARLFTGLSHEHARVAYTSKPFNDFNKNVADDGINLIKILQCWQEIGQF